MANQRTAKEKASKATEIVPGDDPRTPAVGFTRVEKNLASLGFFTPSSKKTKGVKSKSITVTKVIAGKRVQARATILPSAEYGLPITADQDKYLAFLKIVGEIRMRNGKIENPVSFSTADLLRLLKNRVQTGKNYSDIEEWLKRMTVTAISSDGVVYFAGRKRWASDTFHVFERAISFGKELPDGTLANKNYVWLSEWQLENINSNHVLPVDLDTYLRVQNHIAKALVPLLQIWLYASRADGAFEKRYTELCEILHIRKYRHLSDIRRKLEPSLKELKALGYLSDYAITLTADRSDHKVQFFHGEKFFEDQRKLGANRDEALEETKEETLAPDALAMEPVSGDTTAEAVVAALIERGVSKRRARRLLEEAEQPHRVLDQVEWFDHVAQRKSLENPAGLLVSLIKDDVMPPESFETLRKRRATDEARRLEERQTAERFESETAYECFRETEIEKHIQERLGEEQFLRLVDTKKKDLLRRFQVLAHSPEDTVRELAERSARSDIGKGLSIIPFEAFWQEWQREHGKSRKE